MTLLFRERHLLSSNLALLTVLTEVITVGSFAWQADCSAFGLDISALDSHKETL
jgi:hypothetical protein